MRDVEGYGIFYGVTAAGRVWSYKTARWLTPVKTSDGYLTVTLSKKSKPSRHRVHRLVARAYLPNPARRPYVNHKDSVRHNNTVSNLEWCTQQENVAHYRAKK